MKRIGIALVLVLGMVFAGCGDDEVKPKDLKIQLDGGGNETAPGNEAGTETITQLEIGPEASTDAAPACVASVMGKKCTSKGEECGKTNTCLLTSETDGICTCSCTPDDSKTPLVNEDTCPGQPSIQCGPRAIEVTSGGKKSTKNFCWKLCTPELGKNSCTKPFVCHPSSGAQWGIYGKAVCYYSTADYGCKDNDGCQISTGAKCTVSKKDCATGSKCVPWTSGGDNGICVKAGVCDLVSGLCKPQKTGKTAKVGDPCKGDVDCGDNQGCQIQYDQAKDLGKLVDGKTCKSDSECCSGSCTSGVCDKGEPCTIQNRNGYCAVSNCSFSKTMPHAVCPTGSLCNSLYSTGICQKSCKLEAKTGTDVCRGYAKDKMGDYECRSWQALATSGGAIAKGPVCDFGPIVTCSWLKPPAGSTSTLSCAALGTYSGTTNDNKTKMSCRDLTNTVLTDKYSKAGWCFDDTASGCVGTKSDCSGTCVDLQTDAANCGACGTKCTTGQTCTAGKCV